MASHRFIAAVLALSFATAASGQSLPSALAQAVAQTEAAKTPYAFDIELQGGERSWRARFHPDRDPRVSLVAPRRDELSTEEQRAFDAYARDVEGVSWCASENMARVRDVRLLREDATTATYSFQPTAESIRGEQARRYADRLRGEVTLSKETPDVTSLRLFIPARFSPMPLVDVHRFNVTVTCQLAPNGRRFAAETISEIAVSAFGRDVEQRTVQRARILQ